MCSRCWGGGGGGAPEPAGTSCVELEAVCGEEADAADDDAEGDAEAALELETAAVVEAGCCCGGGGGACSYKSAEGA